MAVRPRVATLQLALYSVMVWAVTLMVAAAWSALGPRGFDADTIGLSAFFVAMPTLFVAAVGVLRDLPDPLLRVLRAEQGLSLFVATVIPGLELFVVGGLIGT